MSNIGLNFDGTKYFKDTFNSIKSYASKSPDLINKVKSITSNITDDFSISDAKSKVTPLINEITSNASSKISELKSSIKSDTKVSNPRSLLDIDINKIKNGIKEPKVPEVNTEKFVKDDISIPQDISQLEKFNPENYMVSESEIESQLDFDSMIPVIDF